MRFALVLLLAGCSTVQMETRSGSQYAPVNERNGGRVSYLATGIPPVVASRRDAAYKEMHDHCGGDYRIVAESNEGRGSIQTANATSTGGNSAYATGTNVSVFRRVIDFECVGRRHAEEAE